CEGKVIAYALVLLGWRYAVRGSYGWCWIWLGLAAGFHVLVGGWAVVMTAVGLLTVPRREWSSWPRHAIGLVIGGALSLFGLVPALQLSNGSPEVIQAAQELYVMQRLSHHLMIRDFPPLFVLRHVLLMVVFAAFWWQVRFDARGRRLWGIIWTAILLSAIGATLDASIGGTPLGNSLMRFYWFRASDVFVPLGVVVAALLWWQRITAVNPAQRTARLAFIATLTTICLYCIGYAYQLWTYTIPAADWQGGIRRTREWYDWRDMCEWVRTSTPAGALLLTPADHQTFKWYAERAELVTWKDVPQDSLGLLEWKRRLDDVQAWQFSHTKSEYRTRWKQLRETYDFDYVVIRSRLPVHLPEMQIVFRNAKYQVGMLLPPRDTGDGRQGPQHIANPN
ncbi:MAG: hypothetical protein KDA92_19480, partial [Planctomycetales bacterium]|nr:hypothetical protein [Planctomycetales bacterium]